jgi:glutamine amidotransferase-like uncharacterized protein
MKKNYLFLVLVFAIILFGVVAVTAKKPVPTCPIQSDTDVVFYGDTGFGGVGSLSRSWVIHFLDWWKTQDPSIDYVELDQGDIREVCDLDSFSNLKIYIQPGGNAYYQQRSLESTGRQNILDYINSGKGYLGICAGWYYTATDYIWQDEYYDWPDMLDYYPATVEGSITDIADYEGNPDHALTPLSTGFNAIYYGGPTVGWKDTSLPAPGVTEATFTAIPGDSPAIVKYNDNTLLTSVHLEAFENDGIDYLTTEDRVENYKYLANLLNEVSGTSFYVPPYTSPVCDDGIDNDGDGLVDLADPGCDSVQDNSELGDNECDDGIDNDGDGSVDTADSGCLSVSGEDESNCGDGVCEGGETPLTCSADCPLTQCNDGIDNDADDLIDLADPGCSSSMDDDETDPTGPTELVNDGFESGLGAWIVSGSGDLWLQDSSDPFEGSYAARAKKTGVDLMTYMETSFDATGFSSVTFEYQRKLVGLDAADDFAAEYFDGTWNAVEALGSGRESNDNYISKSFSIPNSATKVRFMCECGAVSEMCYVDNVKVTAE